MNYERLTKREDEKTASINGSSPIDKDFANAINRLAELEDKIEKGLLVERYFLKDDVMPDGKVWHNVCKYDQSSCIIVKQCETVSEAEAKLKELKEK